MAVVTNRTTCAEATPTLVASGTAGEAGNTRNGKAIYPIPVCIKNLGPAVVNLCATDSDDLTVDSGYPLAVDGEIAMDLIGSCGEPEDQFDGEKVYAYAIGDEATVVVIYLRQNAADDDIVPPM